MTTERWQRIEAVAQAALERAATQRAAFLDAACAGDASLREEVESLLAQQEPAARFMETPAVETGALWRPEDPTDTLIGRRLGPYELRQEIGHGGMGAVYLAERADDAYQKQVAIKLVKRGMDTNAILLRFRNERQILATLDHPNIAKLLDGGTTEGGLSYFVMDYVEGLPIDAYCGTHKLSVKDRLKLFRTICAAVQYAYEHHIVHRDLKPGNILVTAEGAPKLLDFGIAKLLAPEESGTGILPVQHRLEACATATGLRPMTPEYASPEQVRGEAITPASDVYALGVLLYELLTGHHPYRMETRTPKEFERIICEEMPDKPSTAIGRIGESLDAVDDKPVRITPESVSLMRDGRPDGLRRQLSGDLDNIVLMALRKEPVHRYPSVKAFSD
ncbi:MAG: serine/threonine protein kinase [Acidobacteria bacterium]|nr:serine/threonine protein kinase [Acidobacteriota bacterium]MBI3655299.1 serine/threonine protein kinase [Acidobacteriota bacterium]